MAEAETRAPPILITVAPNGARRGKTDHPRLPITPKELAREAAACLEAGAAMLHLHVRDAQESHSLDAAAYRAAMAAIRQEVGDRLVLQATSEAVGRYSAAEQMALLRELRPEAASLALREIVPDGAAEPEAGRFFAWLARERVLPQFILYSPEEVVRFEELAARGVLGEAPRFLLFVLGRYAAGQRSSPRDLLPFLAANGAGRLWAVCAFGQREAACMAAAAALDGHLRVGFENNLHLPDGSVAPDNAALVGLAAEAARLAGRPLCDAEAARAIMAGAA